MSDTRDTFPTGRGRPFGAQPAPQSSCRPQAEAYPRRVGREIGPAPAERLSRVPDVPRRSELEQACAEALRNATRVSRGLDLARSMLAEGLRDADAAASKQLRDQVLWVIEHVAGDNELVKGALRDSEAVLIASGSDAIV